MNESNLISGWTPEQFAAVQTALEHARLGYKDVVNFELLQPSDIAVFSVPFGNQPVLVVFNTYRWLNANLVIEVKMHLGQPTGASVLSDQQRKHAETFVNWGALSPA